MKSTGLPCLATASSCFLFLLFSFLPVYFSSLAAVDYYCLNTWMPVLSMTTMIMTPVKMQNRSYLSMSTSSRVSSIDMDDTHNPGIDIQYKLTEPIRKAPCHLTESHDKTEIFNTLNPFGTMGFKASVAIVQTTRFKRKLSSSASFTPPATPFNNTSFLIRLQQLREQYSPKNLRFDQYGSMQNMISSSFAAPLQHHDHPINSSGLQHSNQSSNNFQKEFPNGRILLCDDSDHHEISQQVSDDASSSVTEVKSETDPEIREGDGMRLRQHFMDDNFDIHARGSEA